LTRDKGVPELLEAFDAISIADPNARLLLVGWFDGSEDALCASLRERIRRHPKIHCTGFVDDTAPYYRAMDVLVLPTWREGFPNVVLEAAASGVPVITTVATGSRDSVDPEVTGLLIQPGNPGAITEAVLSLLRNRARRQRMGKAARIWVNEHYVDGRVLQLATMFYTSLVVKEMAGRSAQALQGAGLASVLSAGDKVVGAPICDAGASSV
jgi:glycosyltransferase involved in cell wall biosynthesis